MISRKKITIALSSIIALAIILISPASVLGATTNVVTGDTSAGENQSGWLFNRDLGTATPFVFDTDASSIGIGSVHILPIGANAADKFIAEDFINEPIANVNSISYDFMIGSGGTASDENQFYMSVYANFGESDPLKFYDCRYSVVPNVGSTGSFTTVTFDPTLAYPVTTRGSSPYTCPAIPADMDALSAGSNIRVYALNVGDTSTSDVGLDGYIDNVVVDLDSGVTISDFEPFVASAEITSPLDGSTQSGVVDFTAEYVDEDGDDTVQWAVRSGTCAAGTGTVYGNVDGKSTPFSWNGSSFSSSIDMTGNTPGSYCFIFNPREDTGDANLRITSEFILEEVVVEPTDPTTKNQCKKEGWKDFGFKNQGQCIQFVNTGKDKR